jgi:hypothetical protein
VGVEDPAENNDRPPESKIQKKQSPEFVW